MYIQCKVYLQLCRKWKAYNRTIVVQVILIVIVIYLLTVTLIKKAAALMLWGVVGPDPNVTVMLIATSIPAPPLV